MRWKRSAFGQADHYARLGVGELVSRSPWWVYRAPFHGQCTNPVVMVQEDEGNEDAQGYACETWVRCRKCTWCLRQRRGLWVGRMMGELVAHPRTWFVSLTVSPDTLHRLILRATTRKLGVDGWRQLSEGQRRSLIFWEYGREITDWLKRVRMRAVRDARRADGTDAYLRRPGEPEPRLRYCLCFELGEKGGREHAHLLIHEAQGRVFEEELRTEWARLGYAKAKLVDDVGKAAGYVAKYVGKGPEYRVRASLSYGAWRTANSPASGIGANRAAVAPVKGKGPSSPMSGPPARSAGASRPPEAGGRDTISTVGDED